MVLAVIAIILVSFKLFVSERDSDTSKTLEVSTLSGGLEVVPITSTKEEAITLTKLKEIKIDKELFSRNTFRSLKDFTVKILPEDIGRNNPFAPTGTD